MVLHQKLGRTIDRARLTGSLTAEERALAAAATVPSRAVRTHYLARLAEAIAAEELSAV